MDDVGNSTLANDRVAARKRGIQFRVCRKPRPGARWERVRFGITDLEDAMATALAVEDHEAGIFTDGPGPNQGIIYWTSRDPDVLNSPVITLELS